MMGSQKCGRLMARWRGTPETCRGRWGHLQPSRTNHQLKKEAVVLERH
ncbi:zinc finger protein 1, isoform CRA_a [Mus musculus]|nr:zinc finger protein 1, isoform CRA_a [Mus musculus]